MPKKTPLLRYQLRDFLFSPIAGTSDTAIWQHLVTPQVRALLGPITGTTGPQRMETIQGHFPGDEVTNLNQHGLFGCQSGFVRFPYVSTMYKTQWGAFVVKKSFEKVKALGWVGDVEKGRGELIYKVALRDRRHDGTRLANDCSLLDFPMDDPEHNLPLPGGVSSVEVSLYAFQPGSRIVDACGDKDLDAFVANPFCFVDDPEKFLKLFQKAWSTKRSPGMVGMPIADVAPLIGGGSGFEKIARAKKYDFLEDAASHYHVAMFAHHIGYRPTYAHHADILRQLREGIARIKGSGTPLTRSQESWVCVIQNLPKEHIPEHLYLGGVTWPQDNLSQANLWMNKPLNDRALALMPQVIEKEKKTDGKIS